MPRENKVDKKVRRRRFGIIFFLLLLIISLFLFISLKTDLFNISKIEVIGNEKILDEEIIRASGNVINQNVFRVNKKAIKENLESIPYIKEVKIKRKLPNKILIDVMEREEKAVVPYIGSFIYLDKEGYVLTFEEQRKEEDLLEIITPEIDKPELGECLFDSNEAFEDLDEFIFLGDQIDILKKFVRIDVRDKKNVLIELNSGAEVAFGDLNNIKYKLSFLNSIFKDLDEKNIVCKYIYLEKGENPIVITETDETD